MAPADDPKIAVVVMLLREDLASNAGDGIKDIFGCLL